ncbi:MAG: efflux RND transporter permease subunit [Opitutales bacterium]|nr:efflux RND transporter permease subunit [Opitutales bacterium]
MIEKLIDACLRNRFLVILIALGIVGVGIWSIREITVDAIPDLSDTQVVVVTELPGQAPGVVEDQVTSVLTRSLLAVPQTRDVRGFSMFGVSFVYVIFEDRTDMYWARTRVLEQLSTLTDRLPEAANSRLGPDATGVGWVYQYVLETGPYSAAHPQGVWWDPETDSWYASRDEAGSDVLVRQRLERVRVFTGQHAREDCPLTGEALLQPDLDLSEMRALQDWYLRYELTALDGVSEVASIGGYEKQYQVTVDPATLQAYDISINAVGNAIRRSNRDIGARSLELSEMEYMVWSRGLLGRPDAEFLKGLPQDGISERRYRTARVIEDLKAIPIASAEDGIPVRLGDIARIDVGPQIRQGVADWNDAGETVGAIVVMRHGDNARDTIRRVSERLQELEQGLPAGLAVQVAYDRSDLIDRSIATLSTTLLKEMLAVTLIMILFLLHVRSALVAAVVLPMASLASLSLMAFFGINANIMSLGGIAIAIGVMVDCSIVLVENTHKHLERQRRSGSKESHYELVRRASLEVGPTLFFSLLVITVSFLPIFLLGAESGRLFRPLAYTKTFAMASAALLAVTLTPVLMLYFVRQSPWSQKWRRWQSMLAGAAIVFIPAILLAMYIPREWTPWQFWGPIIWILLAAIVVLPQKLRDEDANPLTRFLEWIYTPVLAFSIRFRWLVLFLAVSLVFTTFWLPFRQLGTEFMPPLEEGDLLYMPTTVEPGLSIDKARELLHQTSRLIYAFPEVKDVHGKIGRAESATDPAPLNMIETTITLHRDDKQWRHIPRQRFFTEWPSWARWLPSKIWSESRRITMNELIYGFELPDGSLIEGLDSAVQIPGLANAWTMPIRARIDMLSTGIRTPVGIKVMGPDLETLSAIAGEVEQAIQMGERTAPYTTSAYAERTVGGKYLQILPRRQGALAQYGLSVDEVQSIIETAVGGITVTETVEGLERFPVNLRYPRELRDNLPRLKQLLVPLPDGGQVPLEQIADFELTGGPPMIKSENARLTAWVYVDISGIDVGTYVREARSVVEREVILPPGYTLVWSGQYENIERAKAQFAIVIPLTLLGIVLLLWLATRSWLRVLLIFSTLSFSVIGAIWMLWLLDYNLSVAVVVGIIALLGLDAETSLIMLLYLDKSHDRWKEKGWLKSPADLWQAVHHGAVRRIRPKTMTVLTTMIGLMPLMFAVGAGADTMRRMAAPMIGGLITSFILELILYPVIYYMARNRSR